MAGSDGMTLGDPQLVATCNARRFSVLMPSHIPLDAPRRVEQLRAAILSVVEQKFDGDYEIVIIDDGSPKPIADLLAEAPLGVKADIRCLRQYRRNGLVQALNRGLAEARYDLIARLDDDDVWLPGKIAPQLARFAADPDLSILGTGKTSLFENGDQPVDRIRPDHWSAILRCFCEGGCPFPHGGLLARKDVFNLLGGYPQAAEALHCADEALWANWIRFFKPGLIERADDHSPARTHAAPVLKTSRNLELSGKIADDFIKLDINAIVPTAIAALAEALSVSRLQSGVVAFRLWYFGSVVRLPRPAVAPLQDLMPDRIVLTGPCGGEPASLSELLQGFGDYETADREEMVTVRCI